MNSAANIFSNRLPKATDSYLGSRELLIRPNKAIFYDDHRRQIDKELVYTLAINVIVSNKMIKV